MNKGTINRRKGHNAERFYANIFKSLGFNKCVTSRYGSRIHDDNGIDLINLPINVQIKAGKQKAMNISKTLYDIKNKINHAFNKEEQIKPLILIHKKEVGKGTKRNEFDEIVSMSFEDFKKLITKQNKKR